jgi:hypothetical protein
MAKNTGSFVDLDPAVAAVIGTGERRQQMRSMAPAQRSRARRDAARNKVTLDLRDETEAAVDAIAQQLGCPVSQVAELLICTGLQAIADGQLDLNTLRLRPSRSPRYEWLLDLPEVPRSNNGWG